MPLTPTAPRPRAAARTTGAPPDGPRPIPTGRILLALAGVAVLVHVRWPGGAFGEAVYLAVAFGAAAAAWAGAHRRAPAARLPWQLVALGVTSSAAGDAIWSYWVLGRGIEPDVSLADPLWLGAYVAVGAGVLVLQARRYGGLAIDAVLTAIAVGVVGVLVLWQASISELVADSSVPATVRVVWAAYPLLDAVLLTLAVATALLGGRPSPARVLVSAGAACWLVSDLLWLTPAAEGLPALLNAGWLVGALLLATSTWARSTPTQVLDPVEATDDEGTTARRMAVLGLAPLLVPTAFALWGHLHGRQPNPIPLAVATVALVGLAFIRALRLIADDRALRAKIRSNERRYRALAGSSSDAVVVIDASGRVVEDSPNLERLVGSPSRPDADDPFDWVAPEDRADVLASLEQALVNPGAAITSEVRYRREGRTIWLSTRAVNLLHDPDVGGIVVTLQDITERKGLEEDLARQAFEDSLTGLANRALLRDRLHQAIRRAARNDSVVSVLYLDLDGFKTVNDSLGHDAGDELLRIVAGRLASIVRPGDTVARLGGDEFAIVTEDGPRSLAGAMAIADRALQAITAPVDLGGQQVWVTASIGIAASDDSTSAADVLRDADVAMYRAKAKGKGRWLVHQPEMRVAAVERQRLEADLKSPHVFDQLVVEYQPVVELDHERLVGFEALLRWDHPELGRLSPDRFIPLAEETGAIEAIGTWVLHQACTTAAAWQRDHPRPEPVTVAVNVSGRQLVSDRLVDEVRLALDESGLAPAALVLEVTETSLVDDPRTTSRILADLHALGVRLAIDDFGTGYSSLSYLRQFPVDILKIDRSFVSSVAEGDEVPPIVRGLIELGHTLGLELVAEGIEQQAQRDRLRSERCTLGQGFLFARPLPPSAAERLLEPPPGG